MKNLVINPQNASYTPKTDAGSTNRMRTTNPFSKQSTPATNSNAVMKKPTIPTVTKTNITVKNPAPVAPRMPVKATTNIGDGVTNASKVANMQAKYDAAIKAKRDSKPTKIVETKPIVTNPSRSIGKVYDDLTLKNMQAKYDAEIKAGMTPGGKGKPVEEKIQEENRYQGWLDREAELNKRTKPRANAPTRGYTPTEPEEIAFAKKVQAAKDRRDLMKKKTASKRYSKKGL